MMAPDRIPGSDLERPHVSLTIRPVAPTDREAWLTLWRDYLIFYETALPDSTTEMTWRRLFDDAEPVRGFVAQHGEEVVGIVHYILHLQHRLAGDVADLVICRTCSPPRACAARALAGRLSRRSTPLPERSVRPGSIG